MKQDWEIYRDTGILGASRPEQVILRRSEDGGVETLFRDSTAKWEGDDLTRQRAMLVGGKCFLVTSVFPGGAAATPTDKLLQLIDTKLEREHHEQYNSGRLARAGAVYFVLPYRPAPTKRR